MIIILPLTALFLVALTVWNKTNRPLSMVLLVLSGLATAGVYHLDFRVGLILTVFLVLAAYFCERSNNPGSSNEDLLYISRILVLVQVITMISCILFLPLS